MVMAINLRLFRANVETLYSVQTGPVVVIGVKGSNKKNLNSEILKTITVGSLYTITTILFSYLGHLYDPTWIHSIQ
jgi:hypothetical protein